MAAYTTEATSNLSSMNFTDIVYNVSKFTERKILSQLHYPWKML